MESSKTKSSRGKCTQMIKKVLNHLVLILAILLVAASATRRLSAFDTGFHVKTGQWICEHGMIPSLDFYSYYAAALPWTNTQWLAQVLLWQSHSIGGVAGLILFAALIITASYLFMIATIGRGLPLISAALILPSVVASSPRFVPRPHIIMLFAVVLYLWALERSRKGSALCLLVLPPMQIVWANCHASFLLGPALLAIYLVGDALQKHVQRLKQPGPQRKSFTALTFALISILICSFITPFGLRVIDPIVSQVGSNVFMTNIREWVSPFSAQMEPTWMWAYLALISATGISFVINLPRIDLPRLILFVLCVALSARAQREVALLAMVAVPIAGLNFASARKRTKLFLRNIRSSSVFYPAALFLYVSVIVALAATVLDVVSDRALVNGRTASGFGLDFEPGIFPERSVKFLQKHELPVRLFNNYVLGGYLIWQLWPQYHVFIDGRNQLYEERLFLHYNNMVASPELWLTEAEKYRINTAILSYSTPGVDKLTTALYKNPNWKLVFFDGRGVVFLKNSPENRELVARLEIAFENPRTEKLIASAVQDDLKGGQLYDQMRSMLPVLPRRAQNAKCSLNVASLLNMFGQSRLAASLLKEIEPWTDNRKGFLAVTGQTYLFRLMEDRNPKDARKAKDAFEALLRIAPKYANAYASLGRLAELSGRDADAIHYYEQAIRLEPGNNKYRYKLATALSETGQYERAKDELRTILRHDPEFTPAHDYLKELKERSQTET